MGRLPAMYAGRPITRRIPWAMSSTLRLPIVEDDVLFRARPFDEGDLRHANDKPFEIHRMLPRSVAGTTIATFADNQIGQLACVELTLRERLANQPLLAEPTAISNLVKGTAEQTWEFADPLNLVMGGGLRATGALRSTDLTEFGVGVEFLDVTITFQGFLLVVTPASDRRS